MYIWPSSDPVEASWTGLPLQVDSESTTSREEQESFHKTYKTNNKRNPNQRKLISELNFDHKTEAKS